MDNICSEEVWKMFLKQNFEVLIKEVKYILIYTNPARKLHNNYWDYLFFNEEVFSEEVQKKLSLYSIFLTFVFVKAGAILMIKKLFYSMFKGRYSICR